MGSVGGFLIILLGRERKNSLQLEVISRNNFEGTLGAESHDVIEYEYERRI